MRRFFLDHVTIALCLRHSSYVPLAATANFGRGLRPEILDQQLSSIRNVGIVAHIDAGKTTTTERMLFYGGVVKRIGEVDSGTTTTDFMEEEMERGITIQAAAVSFQWGAASVNLIDTPGHVDFALEVERSLRVVDGVIALFDASAGVQAQSFSVLRQARKFKTPVIAFLNKMDKENASFGKSVESIRARLGVMPILLQVPVTGDDGSFLGVCDIIEQTCIRFTGDRGQVLVRTSVEEEGVEFQKKIVDARHSMLETLSQIDDEITIALLELLDKTDNDTTAAEALLPSSTIKKAIRKHTLLQGTTTPLMPILCGASRRNMGIQPLLDAVLDYLPSPLDRKNVVNGFTSQGQLVDLPRISSMPHIPTYALAFKVSHSLNGKGEHQPLVFFRVYTGLVAKGARLHNRNKDREEIIDKLYIMHANTPVEVPQISAGNIGAAFLKFTTTGETLYSSKVSLSGCDDVNVHTLEGISIPPPVISYSIEAPRNNLVSSLEEALKRLSREDPSFRFSDNELGQKVVSGMGELHLEIFLSRLKREYGLDCKLLRAVIEYREVLSRAFVVHDVVVAWGNVTLFHVNIEFQTSLDQNDGRMECLSPATVVVTLEAREQFKIAMQARKPLDEEDTSTWKSSSSKFWDAAANEAAEKMLKTIQEDFQKALTTYCARGPLASLPVIGMSLVISRISAASTTIVPTAVRLAAGVTISELLNEHKKLMSLVEPMMNVEVHVTSEEHVGNAMSSLASKHAAMLEMLEDGRSVVGVVPMRNIARYVQELRTATKGNGHFFTRLEYYRLVTEELRGKILSNLGVCET